MCDGQTNGRTDRITTPKTALAYARVVKTKYGTTLRLCVIDETNEKAVN